MTISHRAAVDEVIVDAVCTGRFYDFFEQRAGRWRSCGDSRSTRIGSTVEPGVKLALDPALLASFPEGYRHLGYLQTKAGFKVRLGLPQLRGPGSRNYTRRARRGSRAARRLACRSEVAVSASCDEMLQEAPHHVLGPLL
jgi:hypothetical protein